MRSQITQAKVLSKNFLTGGKKSLLLKVEEKYKKRNGGILPIIWEITVGEDAIPGTETLSEGDYINIFSITTIKNNDKTLHKIAAPGSVEKIELDYNEGDVDGEQFV